MPKAVSEKTHSVQVAYFVNSGSEANDMAMLMARLYTGNYDMLALRNCYHGMSEGTMGVTAHSTWKFSVPQVRGFFAATLAKSTLSPCALCVAVMATALPSAYCRRLKRTAELFKCAARV